MGVETPSERMWPMKLSLLAAQTAPILPLLRCPHCWEAFSLRQEQSLICSQGHCFDLSAKGYVNLAPGHNQQAEKYDGALFASRRLVLQRGFYAILLEAVARMILEALPQGKPFTLLDAGCGEGFYARELARRFPAARVLGLDLSRDAISAAARESRAESVDVHWLVGNLARLPLADHSVDVLLNILTPADYAQFSRVLSEGGFLVKVVPGPRYLEQVRAGVAEHLRSAAYSNQRVLEHLQAHGQILERCSVLGTFPVTPQEAAAFLSMTPMTFGVGEEALGDISFSEITLDLEILRVRM